MIARWLERHSASPRLPVDPLGILGLLALVALWWGLSQFHFLSQLALPPPAGVAAAITQNFFSSSYLANYHLGYGGLAGNLAYTISNVVVALAVSCVVGVALGFASARVELFRAFADPIMLTAGTISDPRDRAVLLDLVRRQPKRPDRFADSLRRHDRISVRPARRGQPRPNLCGGRAERSARGRWRIVSDVYLKGALPEVFGGIRIALAGAWGLEAFSELLGAPKGIGRVIQAMAAEMDSQMVFAAIMTLAVVAVAFDVAIGGAFDFITRWRRRARL